MTIDKIKAVIAERRKNPLSRSSELDTLELASEWFFQNSDDMCRCGDVPSVQSRGCFCLCHSRGDDDIPCEDCCDSHMNTTCAHCMLTRISEKLGAE